MSLYLAYIAQVRACAVDVLEMHPFLQIGLRHQPVERTTPSQIAFH
jgi:hypothetical protein